jgi:hypothetical protein
MRTTHYQVGHPIFFGFLIHSCTSPDESKTQDKVISDVYKVLKDHKYNCSREAAKFLVRMAKDMGFLEVNNIWTWKAFVINYFEEIDDITQYFGKTIISSTAKKITYLKYYLESDGAFLIHFARKVLDENGLSKRTIRFTNKAVEPIFENVINEYLAMEKSDFRKKVQLENFLKLLRRGGYQSKVRIHKAFPHLDPLVDLGILDYDSKKHEYLPKMPDGSITKTFLHKFPDISSLEEPFLLEEGIKKNSFGYYERAAEVYNISYRKFSQKDTSIISNEIAYIYSKIKDKVTGLASIKSIKDIVCALSLVNHGILCEWPDIDEVLRDLKSEKGVNLRFHVDRAGKIAYIVLAK